MLTLNVYTLNEENWSYEQLFRLWREANGDGLEVQFDFSGCGFLRQNAVAFLGGLARLIEYRGGRVEFVWDTLADDVGANLAQNGFMETFGGPRRSWTGNSIPFRHDLNQDAHTFEDYLTRLWLGRGWVNVSPGLGNAIVGNMAEIYLNAFEHGQSKIGVFACGQHFPKNRELNLAIVDFGVGIPSNVRSFKANDFAPEELAAANCMEWAFQRGTSTKPGGRGIGLDLLQDFVRQNGGRLEMFSHEGYVLIADCARNHGCVAALRTVAGGRLRFICPPSIEGGRRHAGHFRRRRFLFCAGNYPFHCQPKCNQHRPCPGKIPSEVMELSSRHRCEIGWQPRRNDKCASHLGLCFGTSIFLAVFMQISDNHPSSLCNVELARI